MRATEKLGEAFAQAMELAEIDDIVSRGDTVLVKPNQHGALKGTTSPEVTRAAIEWAFDSGASEVWVGDGSVWSLKDVAEYFSKTGLAALCEETGAKLLNFHEGDYRIIEPDSPHLPPTIGISRYLYDADVVINLPLMKTHFNTLVSLGVKNLKGCLRPSDKRGFHQMELNAAIAEAYWHIEPQVTAAVMDATTAMEGMGPGAGTPVEMGVVLASEDTLDLDIVACGLMGIDPEQVRLLRFCVEFMREGCGPRRPTRVGEYASEVRRQFELPYEAMEREFPDLNIDSDGACSGCALNLFRALEIAKAHDQPITYRTVAIGPEPRPWGRTLLIGHCTRRARHLCGYLEGCPPTVEAIRHRLTGIGPRDDVPKS